VDPCAGITVTVNSSSTNPTTGSNNGSISATASGAGAPFTFSLNSGSFQSSGSFTGLAAGSYIITAKSSSGCMGSTTVNLVASNPNLCTGVTIAVSSTVVGNRPCETANGSITVTATGGTGAYTYSLNGGVFQSTNVLVAGPGNFNVTAKDANGCTGTQSNISVGNLTAGPLFTAVKNVLVANCNSCHNNVLSEGGMNWEIDCNIVDFRIRIRERAVAGNPSIMPPTGSMPPSEQAKITTWINAGGRFTD
jgi:hypothetical protein